MLIRAPSDVGALVRDRRKQLGLDQATLARRIGVSRQWIIGVERGHARAELGLALRALDELGFRLEATTEGTGRRARTSLIDIDDIVASARKTKR